MNKINHLLASLCLSVSFFSITQADPLFQLQQLDNLEKLEGSTKETLRIYFIRHGESEFNVTDSLGVKYTSGKGKEIQLTDRGLEQARLLGKELSHKVRTDAVICSSTAMRAKQTAEEIMAQFKEKDIPYRNGGDYEGLSETSMGIWEGKPKDEAFKSELSKWEALSAQDKFTTPKVSSGESFIDVAHRALDELQSIIDANKGKTLFIVSHNFTLNALAIYWTNPPLQETPGSLLPLTRFNNCDMLMVEIPIGEKVESATVKMVIQASK